MLKPSNSHKQDVLHSATIDTPLGPMIAIANNVELYLLEFVDRQGLERKIEQFKNKTKSVIVPNHNPIIGSIKSELESYFAGELQKFKTPILMLGSSFQQRVWLELQKIPFGKTIAYANLAQAINQPTACRAVAQANGANQLSLIIPCHRVISADGTLGGYGNGITRKAWLLNHEKQMSVNGN